MAVARGGGSEIVDELLFLIGVVWYLCVLLCWLGSDWVLVLLCWIRLYRVYCTAVLGCTWYCTVLWCTNPNPILTLRTLNPHADAVPVTRSSAGRGRVEGVETFTVFGASGAVLGGLRTDEHRVSESGVPCGVVLCRAVPGRALVVCGCLCRW